MNIPDPIYKVGQRVEHKMYRTWGIMTILKWRYENSGDREAIWYEAVDANRVKHSLYEGEIIAADEELDPRLPSVIEAAHENGSRLMDDLNDLTVILPASLRYRAAEQKQDLRLVLDYIRSLRTTYCKVSGVGNPNAVHDNTRG